MKVFWKALNNFPSPHPNLLSFYAEEYINIFLDSCQIQVHFFNTDCIGQVVNTMLLIGAGQLEPSEQQ